MSEAHVPSARTRVVRESHRGVYDRATAYEILDEGFICHVGFVVDGQPPLHSRLARQPHVAPSRPERGGMRHGDVAGGSCAGSLDFQSLYELSFGGRVGHGGCSRGRKGKAGSLGVALRAHSPWTLGGITSAQREGTQGDAGNAAAHRRIFGESTTRSAH